LRAPYEGGWTLHSPAGLVRIDLDNFTRLYACDSRLYFVKHRQNVLHTVANIHDHDRTDADLRKVLLKPKALVRGEDYREAAIDSRTKENPIAETLELFTPDDRAVKLREKRLDLLWNGLVNE